MGASNSKLGPKDPLVKRMELESKGNNPSFFRLFWLVDAKSVKIGRFDGRSAPVAEFWAKTSFDWFALFPVAGMLGQDPHWV